MPYIKNKNKQQEIIHKIQKYGPTIRALKDWEKKISRNNNLAKLM